MARAVTTARLARALAVLAPALAALLGAPAPSAGAGPATTITAALTTSNVVTGSTAYVQGTVSAPDATPRVVVQRNLDGSWLDRAAGSVDQVTGAFRIPVTPSEHGTYTLRLRSNGGSVVSPVLLLEALPRPTTITARLSAPTVQQGSPVLVRGTVIEHDALRRVVVQRKVGASWADRVAVNVDRQTGAFTATVTPSEAGVYLLRVRSDGGTRESQPLSLLVSHRPAQVIAYSVETRGASSTDVDSFATHAAATMADGRGWSLGGSIEFRRVPSGGSFTLVLSAAGSVPGFGPPCDATFSCRSGRYVIINETRWRTGAPGWSLSLDSYRHYVVNHELGHWLGQGHVGCPGAGAPAPVMMQQSKHTSPCTNTVWPLSGERSQVAARRGVPIW